MQKVLFIGAGSPRDPGFEDVYIGDQQYRQYMRSQGITVIDPIAIESCHRCRDIMDLYSNQTDYLTRQGERVVGLLQGGLTFALPSLQATQVSYPIISSPLDKIAYGAFIVPSGTAVIATAAIEEKNATDGTYQQTQRRKALLVAEKLLNFKGEKVCVDGDGNLDLLVKELEGWGIETSDKSPFVLNFGFEPGDYEDGVFQVWADYQPDLTRGSYLDEHSKLADAELTVQVHGYKNLAFFAAKVLSLQNTELAEKIKKVGSDARKAMGDPRDLTRELKKI